MRGFVQIYRLIKYKSKEDNRILIVHKSQGGQDNNFDQKCHL